MLCLASVFVLVPPAPVQRAIGSRLEEEAPRPFLYYDYVEDGELRGGTVPIDPNDPLHVDTGVQRFGPASPVTTLVDNGPTANRIDLVFVGDGYTDGELGQYAADVDALWPAFLAEPPFDEYASYFNVHRVDVTSLESGVDNDPVQGISRQTALDMTYWCSGTQRLLCVNVSKANAQARNAPDRDCVLALANSTTYGGAGYSSLATLAGRNGAAIEIALHEFGHSFADLADEYEYGGPATYSGPEPSERNVSIYAEPELLALGHKWHLWLDLPNVGTFEGARYSRYGIYRPTLDSKMRNLGRPFEEVNSERIVRFVYGFVDPIDDATPAGAYPLDADFFVDPMDPVGHALDVQWSLDGVAIPGATGVAFDAGSLGPSSRPHVLSVEVVDNTPLVRGPGLRSTHLTAVRSWTLTPVAGVPAPAPAGPVRPLLLVAAPSRGGALQLQLVTPADSSASVPFFFLSAERAPEPGPGPRIDLGGQLLGFQVGEALVPGRPCRVSLPLPVDAARLERPLHVQAALHVRDAPHGSRLLWSNALELVVER